ncbi:RTP1-C1 domain-containing protein [Thermococcus sp. MV5]|uniref:HEAT repeat domain-containing protein n=1 Tax=Thermococcus sp. MV5 TaxID=1638272 RepID=UPI001F104125|nr:RTP1-C1 domain-containing protein [Thermococcus sp. MV5]
MLSQGDLEEILISAMKDQKYVDAIIELLDEENPGLKGDALLLLGELVSRHKDLMMEYVEEGLPLKTLLLVNDPDPYVKENAMQTFELMLRFFPWIEGMFRDEIIEELIDILERGDKNRKAFAMLMLKKLKVKEVLPIIEQFKDVTEAVILPLEGVKWVSLGEIAREVIKDLGGERND